MKKGVKKLATALALVLGVGATLALGACKEKHTHVYGEWERATATGDCEQDTFRRVCDACGGEQTRRGTEDDHTWTAEYGCDYTAHWFTCEACDAQKEAEAHVDNGANICRICNGLMPSDGVTYALSEDGEYAYVTGYDGVDTRAVIAPTYEGVPVTEVAAEAFLNEKGLWRVYFPTTLEKIGERAFQGCKNLMGAFIPESVTTIGDDAFADCVDALFYCEVLEQPQGWSESWRENTYYAYWGREQRNMTEVAANAVTIADSALKVDPDRPQLVANPDVGGVVAPEGFSTVVRFDAQTEGAFAWGKGKSAIWNYNFNGMNLAEYSDVWFAMKLDYANWVFIDGKTPTIITPWTYFHFEQLGKDIYGIRQWKIDISVGGQTFTVFEEQSGSHMDNDRPLNSIARMLWDDGFSSPDRTAALIYSDWDLTEARASFYSTEIIGVKMGM